MQCIYCGSFYVSCLSFNMLSCMPGALWLVACWERVYLLALLPVMILSLSHMVSRVRCGTGFNGSLSSSVFCFIVVFLLCIIVTVSLSDVLRFNL